MSLIPNTKFMSNLIFKQILERFVIFFIYHFCGIKCAKKMDSKRNYKKRYMLDMRIMIVSEK